MTPPLRFALIGAGFWAKYQLHAWHEVEGARCVAVCDPARDRATALARAFGIEHAHDDVNALLDAVPLDFADIVSAPASHGALIRRFAARGIPVICQKPLCPELAEAEAVATECERRGVPLLVHENFRWQTPLRRLHVLLASGQIGRPWRARIGFNCSFPVFENQPSLRGEERLILADLGAHTLDVARWLFGEATTVVCRTAQVNSGIRGEDAATILLGMRSGMTVVNELSFGSVIEEERFPQTFVTVEGERGSLRLGPDFRIALTTKSGTTVEEARPPAYAWADPRYAVVHASIPPCHANLLAHLRGAGAAETTASDNLRTLRLVEACYQSAATGGSCLNVAG